MNNITFPEMDSVTSSASDSVLKTLDQNFNIFKTQPTQVPQQVIQPILQVQQVQPVLQVQPVQPVQQVQPVQPVQQQVSRPQQRQTQPQQSQQRQSQQPQQPQSQSQPQKQPQQQLKAVSFNHNIQQKVIPSIIKKNTLPTVQDKSDNQEVNIIISPSKESPKNTSGECNHNIEAVTSATAAVIGSHLIKFGKVVVPKQTLLLLGILIVVSVGLFYATKNKPVNRDKKKKLEDSEEK